MKIFITGVSSGLGLYIAKEFLDSGDEVWGIGRRKFKLKEVDNNLQNIFRYEQCDTSKGDQVKSVFNKMVKADYIPDRIIFCAGSVTEDITERNFQLCRFKENYDVNLFGILYWVELFLPYFIERNQGSFSAISSMSVYRESRRGRIGYSSSRIALNKAFENLCLEYSDSGVKFIVFNMGRMLQKSGVVGVSYSNAAYRIHKTVKSSGCSRQINIPFFQYILTRIAQLIPKKIFKSYLMK
jgi:short-subunit dehydrogenase